MRSVNNRNYKESAILVKENSFINLGEYVSLPYELLRSGHNLVAVADNKDEVYLFLDFFNYVHSDEETHVKLIGPDGQDLILEAMDAPEIKDIKDSGLSDELQLRLLDIGELLEYGALQGYTDEPKSEDISFKKILSQPPQAPLEEESNFEVSPSKADVTEDSLKSATGKIETTGIDDNSTLSYKVDNSGTYGEFVMGKNGDYQYILDNSHDMVDSLAEGETLTDTITVTVSNGTESSTSIVTITITGSNDVPSLSESSGKVTEGDTAAITGTLDGHDVDNGASLSYSTSDNGSYGRLTVDSNGTYSYTINSSNETVDSLDEGETLTDTITVIVTDEYGATATTIVTITI
ncbi:MAG: VCBS domain-containing protein, partial [Alphaproteobacteria bacterium]